jgi:hypothetical protein
MFHQNYLALLAGGKPNAVWSQSISGVSVINPLVAFYDIHGRKRVLLFFYFVPDTKQDLNLNTTLKVNLDKL